MKKIMAVVILFGGIAMQNPGDIPSEKNTETQIYEKNWNLKARVKDSVIYDQKWDVKGFIRDGVIYDNRWNVKGRISGPKK